MVATITNVKQKTSNKIMNSIRKIFFYFVLPVMACMGLTSCMEEDTNNAIDGAYLSKYLKIYEVRETYFSSDVQLGPATLDGAEMTTGVVISDISGNNFPKEYVVIQSTDDISTSTTTHKCIGLVLKLDRPEDNVFVPGDSLIVYLNGTVLKNVDGLLQITDVTKDKIVKVKSGIEVAPKTLTLRELYKDFERYNSTLIRIDGEFGEIPQANETLSGAKKLNALSEDYIYLVTRPEAEFSNKIMPRSAQYTGIGLWENGQRNFYMQTSKDMQCEAGPLYETWPEDFEYPSIKELGLYNDDPPGLIPRSMTSYDYGDNLGYLKTGKWEFYFAILVDPELSETLGRDRISEVQGIRIQQKISTQDKVEGPARLEMKFDLPEGASKITYTYGSYYNDAKSTFVLEYSIDKGKTWHEAHNPLSDPDKEMRVSTTMLDIKVPVRFRIKKGLNTSVDGRLSIDNIYVYKGKW